MIKNILKQIRNHKLASFVLFAGSLNLVIGNFIIGCILISVSLPLFDDEN
jgi:hypothetical protein